MSKLLKIIGRSAGISAEWILILFLVFVFAIRTYPVQTYIAKQFTSYLSNELNTEVHIEAVEFIFFDRVLLKNFSIKDKQNVDLIKMKEAYATMNQFALFGESLHVKQISFRDGEINVSRDKETGEFNYQFIVDYFDEPDDPDAEPLQLEIDQIELSNVQFRYDDYREPEQSGGMDFNHIGIKDLQAKLTHFKMKDDTFLVNVNHISCAEKSGFSLKELSTSVFLREGSIRLKNLSLESDISKLRASHFEMNFNTWEDFDSFNEKVRFDVSLDSSVLSLVDLALFVPDIDGMDSNLGLKGEFKNALNEMNIDDFTLYFGDKSFIHGNFQLPDFFTDSIQEFQQNFTSAFIDFEDVLSIKMPSNSEPIVLDEYLSKNRFLDISNMQVNGSTSNFDFKFEDVKSALGELRLPVAMNFDMDSNRIVIQSTEDYLSEVLVSNLQLGQLLNEDLLGRLNGSIRPRLEFDNFGNVSLKLNPSKIANVEFNGYRINEINLGETLYKNEKLTTSLQINDQHVKLDLSCGMEVGKTMSVDGLLNVELLDLDVLNFTSDSSKLATSISVSLAGNSITDYSGLVNAAFINYEKGIEQLEIPEMRLSLYSNKESEEYNLNSSLLDVELKGIFDWDNLLSDFTSDLAAVFPTLKVGSKTEMQRGNNGGGNDISFKLLSKDMNRVLHMFAPGIEIANESGLSGSYNSSAEYLDILFSSPRISYGDFIINDIYGSQRISNDSIFSDYIVDYLIYNDSLQVDQIEFFTDGTEGMLNSRLSWAPGTDEESQIYWDTKIHDNDHLEIILKPSFFTLDGFSWNVVNASDISITTEDIHINKFELKRGDQLISINGCVSENDFDKLNFNLMNLNISELGTILGLENKLDGTLSGWGILSNPYSNFQYMGDLSLDSFFIDNREVGDMLVQTNWNSLKNGINMLGELNVNDIQTFNFSGFYFLENEVLDLYLDFDDTDISFVNAFVDPEDVSDIGGTLNGRVKLSGEINAPKLNGSLSVDAAQAKLEILGVKYYLDGAIEIQEDLFALNSVPVRDEEGNTGSLVGTIFHENFQDWNFDVQVNFEDDMTRRQKEFPYHFEPLEQFLVLNTSYKEGDIYFGKAYGRGTANISGYANNMEITLDIETRKGTEVNFPMYGVSDIEEDFDFVSFVNDNISSNVEDDKVDLTGLDLDLNFKVTPDAQVKIIFDPHIGDQIVATGSGDLNITLDQYNEVNLTGTYEISGKSKYNFAMGIIKQDFDIEEGSILTWTGDPYNANIELITSFRMKKVSLVDLSPEQIDNSLTNQEVVCYLNLNETLLKPEISFDIKSPNAPETGKALINRVVNDDDELSRQFFSLLLLRKFQPLKGTITAGGSAALDLAESQINALLGQVSENYDFNFNSALDEVFGENSVEFGVSKSFLEDRLIISGSFGIENKANLNTEETDNPYKAGFIGDLFVEYLINESGTFRATAFNQSNSNTLNENAGQFTQGAGISYHEDFNNAKDFKFLQYFFDIFRSKDKKKYPIKKKKKQTRIE